MVTLLATVFVLGVLIFVHEVGHFLVAKLFKIKVERFSIGYPPRVIGKKIGETDYCISAVPFGGYVKIAGMVDESLDEEKLKEEPKPWEFRSKSSIQKILVVMGGPLMNIGLAFVIYFAATLNYGVPDTSGPVYVGSVVPGNPAAKTGILPGDEIIAVNGKKVTTWDELTKIIYSSPGKPCELSWMRHDSLFTAKVTPIKEKMVVHGDIREVGLIGISPKFKTKKVGVGTAVVNAGMTTYYLTHLVIVSIVRLIEGKESIRSLAGPIAIAKIAGESARSGWGSLIGFLAFLSLDLGLLNLLPIPALDGGHVMFLGIEGVIRKEIPIKVKLIIQQIGMFLLIALMIFVVYNDIVRLIHK